MAGDKVVSNTFASQNGRLALSTVDFNSNLKEIFYVNEGGKLRVDVNYEECTRITAPDVDADCTYLSHSIYIDDNVDKNFDILKTEKTIPGAGCLPDRTEITYKLHYQKNGQTKEAEITPAWMIGLMKAAGYEWCKTGHDCRF